MNGRVKKQTHDRLNRIAGQVQGIARMVEDDRPATDVLVQLASVQAAISKTGQLVLRSLAREGLAAAVATGRPTDRDRRVDELMELLGRYSGIGGR